MRIYSLLNLEPKIDLGKTLGKNLLIKVRLVRLICKFAKSVIETSSKIQESKTYNKAISDFIHGNKWWEIVDKELWNLNTY